MYGVVVESIIHHQVLQKSICHLKRVATLRGQALTDLHMKDQVLILPKATEVSITVPVAQDSTGRMNATPILLLSREAKRQENQFCVLKLFFRLKYAAISMYCCQLIQF